MNKILLALATIAAVNAHADEAAKEATHPSKGFVAGLAGSAFITSTGGGSHFIYGARAGFSLGHSDSGGTGSLGVAVNTLTDSETVSGVKVDSRITFIGAEYVAREAFGTGLYFGGRAGIGINSATVTAGTTTRSLSDTVFAFAPAIGYEVRLSDKAMLMLDTSWINVSGGSFTVGTTTAEYDRTAAVAIQAGIGINF